jgi:REP element-mobilizing transposase RayT
MEPSPGLPKTLPKLRSYRVRLRGVPKTVGTDVVFEKIIACFKRHQRNLYDKPDFVLCDVSRRGGCLDLLVAASCKGLVLERLKKLKINCTRVRCRLFNPTHWKSQHGFAAWLVNQYGLDSGDPGRRRVRVGQRRPIGNNLTYHVWNRTAHGRLLFGSAEKDLIVTVVCQICRQLRVQLHTFVVMDNHFHLIVTTQNDTSISELMHQIDWQISTQYNRLHKTVGTLWQGPFKHSIWEPTAVNLLRLIDYVHANPLRAGLVTEPGQYRWSSFSHYAGTQRRKALVVPLVLRRRWPQRIKRERCYLEHFNCQYRSSKLQYDAQMGQVGVVGSDKFVKTVKATLAGPERLPAFLSQVLKLKRLGVVWGLKTLLHLLCQPLVNTWLQAQNMCKELVDRIEPLVPFREAPA